MQPLFLLNCTVELRKKDSFQGKFRSIYEIFQVELKGTKPCPSVGPHDFHPLINKHPLQNSKSEILFYEMATTH